MEFFEVVKKRRSIRSYVPSEIPEEVIKRIVDAGRLAPTARNEQPWEFVVIRDREKLVQLAKIVGRNGPFLKDCGCAIVVLCRPTKQYLEDGSSATENILLASTALGLGSCWIAGDKKDYAGEVLDFCGAPRDYKLVSIVAIGEPSDESLWSLPKNKRSLEEVLHWERFGKQPKV